MDAGPKEDENEGGMRRIALVMLAATAVAGGSPATAAAASFTAVVNVSAATLWTAPGQLRAVDIPSSTSPVDMNAWLSGMTTAQRGWLVGRLQTQALYGTKVTVLRMRGGWSQVAVAAQSTPQNPLGYPGWLRTRQLTGNTSLLRLRATHPVAVVAGRLAWLRDPSTLARRLRVSFATRLVVVGRTATVDLVATPLGGRLAIMRSAVAEYRSASAIPVPAGSQVVATARRFLGLPYLWAGTSGFGVDCSGLTYLVLRRWGIDLPRDADRQALHGTPVARSALRAGDLVFFAGPGGTGPIHHVGIYVGGGVMIDSPRTGLPVRQVALSAFGSEYAGARRYL
jgi:gamma-D-glutamyl-L-lysine dipeptidyl-peptidase